MSGDAKVELKSILKQIADIGIEGAAKYQKTEYENVLRKDLAPLLKDSNSCKLKVFNDLKDKLLLPPQISQRPKQPAVERRSMNFTRTFAFEDHHCSINEVRAANICADAGFVFRGMVGEPRYSSKDKCGSQFVSFAPNPENKQCGIFKVRLIGCGHDWSKTCKGHAYIKGSVTLSGVSE